MQTLRSTQAAAFALLTIGTFYVSGCSSASSPSEVQVGAITFTDVNGTAPPQTTPPPTSLAVGQGTYVDVALTKDSQLLGADWNVVCGSALPPGTPLPPGQPQDQSCGTFTPAHTMSGPIPSYVTNGKGYVALYTAPAAPPKQGVVTLYASATADPSRFATVTLTIGGSPISVGFAPATPSTLGTNEGVLLKAALNNDATNAGVSWSVLCGSSNCGYFGPVQTVSGVATTYTAPGAVPTGGSVQVTATSIADPTKAATATIQILPVSISVTPTALSVATPGTGSFIATVTNDAEAKGVDWTVSCTNPQSPGQCGSISSHTASGATATYTAPNASEIAVDTPVLVTATSTGDPAESAAATVTTIKGDLVAGSVRSGQQAVTGAQVTLYAATTTETPSNSPAPSRNASAVVTAFTDREGNFSIPYGYDCPTPDTQMYLIASGGNGGGGTNQNLAFLAALGACSTFDASRVIVNEATTVAAVYALSGFMVDPQHVGSSVASPTGMTAAFATAKDLVDVTSGLARTQSVSGVGIAPQVKLNSLASLLNSCAVTAGSEPGDGSACDQMLHSTNTGATLVTQPTNTAQALLNLVRNEMGFPNHPDSLAVLYLFATSNHSFQPAVEAEPSDWTMAIQFPNGQVSYGPVAAKSASTDNSNSSVDSAGNIWVRGDGEAVTEFVGAASCMEAGKVLPSITARTENTP